MRPVTALTALIAVISCCGLWLDRYEQARNFAYSRPVFSLFAELFGFTASVALLPIIIVVHVDHKPRQPYLFCFALFLDLSPWFLLFALGWMHSQE
jgi:hypothetical protein